IAPKLRSGRNVVAALVFNWGATHPVAQHSHRTGFLLQGEGEREAAINSGAGWKLRVDSAYKFVPLGFGDVRGYYAASPAESVDAARYPWGWERPDFDDSGWLSIDAPPPGARTGGRGGGGASGPIVGRLALRNAPGVGEGAWLLVPRDIPPMEETPMRFASVRRVE